MCITASNKPCILTTDSEHHGIKLKVVINYFWHFVCCHHPWKTELGAMLDDVRGDALEIPKLGRGCEVY